MKFSIETSIQIDATPEKVWKVLTDFPRYPEWNPLILSLKGKVDKGRRIKVKFAEMSLSPTVMAYKTNEEFIWLGHLFLPGIFDGQHSFIIRDNADGTVTFIQREQFNGILAGLLKNYIVKKTKPGFIKMNQKLKEVVETERRHTK